MEKRKKRLVSMMRKTARKMREIIEEEIPSGIYRRILLPKGFDNSIVVSVLSEYVICDVMKGIMEFGSGDFTKFPDFMGRIGGEEFALELKTVFNGSHPKVYSSKSAFIKNRSTVKELADIGIPTYLGILEVSLVDIFHGHVFHGLDIPMDGGRMIRIDSLRLMSMNEVMDVIYGMGIWKVSPTFSISRLDKIGYDFCMEVVK